MAGNQKKEILPDMPIAVTSHKSCIFMVSYPVNLSAFLKLHRRRKVRMT